MRRVAGRHGAFCLAVIRGGRLALAGFGEGLGHDDDQAALETLATAVGGLVGFDFAALGLEAEQGTDGAVGLTHHEGGLVGPGECVGEGQAGFIGLGEAALGALGGCDEVAGEIELGDVGGLEGGDLGDGGLVAVVAL